MKVIELLAKIANGEEVPKKILYKYSYKNYYKEYHLKWNEKYKGYYTTNDKTPITHLLADNLWNLNDEVEIIEEDKKIEKIEMVGCNIKVNLLENETFLPTENLQTEFIIGKINEIIDKINGGTNGE